MMISPSSAGEDDDKGKELRAFRYRRSALRELDKMAKEMNIAASQLADYCLEEGLVHIVLKRDIHAVTLGREDMMSILELIKSIEKIKRVGKDLGGSVPKQLYALHNVEPIWKALLWALDQVHSKACGWFEFKHYSNQDRTGKEVHRLIFTHEAGIRWTAFLEGYMTSMLKSLLKVEPKVITATDKMLELTT